MEFVKSEIWGSSYINNARDNFLFFCFSWTVNVRKGIVISFTHAINVPFRSEFYVDLLCLITVAVIDGSVCEIGGGRTRVKQSLQGSGGGIGCLFVKSPLSPRGKGVAREDSMAGKEETRRRRSWNDRGGACRCRTKWPAILSPGLWLEGFATESDKERKREGLRMKRGRRGREREKMERERLRLWSKDQRGEERNRRKARREREMEHAGERARETDTGN